METLRLTTITPVLAAQLLAGLSRLDPAGVMSEDAIPGMARRGDCFLTTNGQGDQSVLVMRNINGVAWVDACAARGGHGWTEPLFSAIERQSQGLRAVAFQTARAGLARRAQALGYGVAGYILRKDLP